MQSTSKSRVWQLLMETMIYPLLQLHSSTGETNISAGELTSREASTHSESSTAALNMPSPIKSESNAQKSEPKSWDFLDYSVVFCEINSCMNSLSSAEHTPPAYHLLDHQASHHHRSDPRTPPSSYSRTTQTCWHTLHRSCSRPARTHSHPRHICGSMDKHIAMHGTGGDYLYQSESVE